MPTGLKVFFSSAADKDFNSILNYINETFGNQATINFRNLILNFIDILSVFPEAGTLEDSKRNISGLVVHRRLKVLYQIKEDKIILLRLFDTRQKPTK